SGYRTITKKYIDEKGNFQETRQEKTDDPKFDALIGFKSNVYEQIIKTADEVIKVYLKNSQLEPNESELYTVPDLFLYNSSKAINFDNSIHEKYSQLNKLEIEFARELDKFNLK
ncbi:11440_t:CDS:2, partial [Ambispora leptoticha]